MRHLTAVNSFFFLVNVITFASSIFQLTWGASSNLYYQKVIDRDHVTESITSLANDAKKQQTFKRIFPDTLITCGCLLLFTTVFGVVVMQIDVPSQVKEYATPPQIFITLLWIQIFVGSMVVTVCLGIKDTLVFSESTAMDAIKALGKDVSAYTLETMDYYQKKFTCCGSSNISDWFKPSTLKIPISCCKRPQSNCSDQILAQFKTNSNSSHAEIQTKLNSYLTNNTHLHQYGCNDAITTYLNTSATIIGINIFLLICIHVIWLLKWQQNEIEKVRPIKIMPSFTDHAQTGEQEVSGTYKPVSIHNWHPGTAWSNKQNEAQEGVIGTTVIYSNWSKTDGNDLEHSEEPAAENGSEDNDDTDEAVENPKQLSQFSIHNIEW